MPDTSEGAEQGLGTQSADASRDTADAALGLGQYSLFSPPPVGLGQARFSVESPLLYDAGGFVGLRPATPENATLKAGDFYLKVASVSGSMLHSDNVNWTATHPASGTIAILRLGTVAMYQFAENLQLAVGGSLVYLPLEGKAGISGFGIQDPLYALSTRPIFRAQLTYGLHVGEWDVRLSDEFRITAGIAAPPGIGFNFSEQSVAGQYVFHDEFRPVGIEDSFVIKENQSGASASRVLPTETRLTVGGSRSYYWYDGMLYGVYPARRDTGYVALDSELKDLRFKPYAIYKIDRYDLGEYDHQQVRVGFRGPVTENVAVLAGGGFYWQDGVKQQGAIWDAQIQHVVSPRLNHRASYGRYVMEPFGDIEERAMYSIRQGLSSVLSLGLSAYESRFIVSGPGDVRGTQHAVNVGIRAEVFPEGGLEVGGGWVQESYDSVLTGSRDTWLARVRLRYKTLEGELVYRFLDRQSQEASLKYRENLFTLTVSKYF